MHLYVSTCGAGVGFPKEEEEEADWELFEDSDDDSDDEDDVGSVFSGRPYSGILCANLNLYWRGLSG